LSKELDLQSSERSYAYLPGSPVAQRERLIPRIGSLRKNLPVANYKIGQLDQTTSLLANRAVADSCISTLQGTRGPN